MLGGMDRWACGWWGGRTGWKEVRFGSQIVIVNCRPIRDRFFGKINEEESLEGEMRLGLEDS